MIEDYYKFPSTSHLAILGENVVRVDKVMSERERNDFLSRELVIEEKVDGANLGISFDSSGNIRLQNRGSYLNAPYQGQWKKLSEWLTPKNDLLFEVLQDKLILFGEWCYAQHSVYYNRLPDWFLGFDIFHKKDLKFFSCQRRDEIFNNAGISGVPLIKKGHFSLEDLTSLLSKSCLGDESAEGIYLRFDDGDWLGNRAKLVRPEFIQSIEEHWSKRKIKPNRLIFETLK